MRRIEVSEEQYEFVQSLRAEMAESVVGEYGFVRERDAVQYLIDNLDADDIDVEGDFERSAVDDVTESVDAAMDGAPDPQGETMSYEEEPVSEEPSTDEDEPEPDEDEPEAEEDAGDEPEGTGDDEDTDAEATPGGAAGPADDDDMLDEMMNLLETHDDKWEESSSADYRYAVELPDGTTEDVQTKDDVRALLFQHYR